MNSEQVASGDRLLIMTKRSPLGRVAPAFEPRVDFRAGARPHGPRSNYGERKRELPPGERWKRKYFSPEASAAQQLMERQVYQAQRELARLAPEMSREKLLWWVRKLRAVRVEG